jgi:CheY-like chemotaxis protein
MLILFVDDDIEEFDIFCEGLKASRPATKCKHVLNGLEAFKLLKAASPSWPDYIFLDINMPIMDGKEFLQKIKLIPRLRNIPVIVYSTSSNPLEIQTFKKLGADDFVVKPGSFKDLVNILKRIIPQKI